MQESNTSTIEFDLQELPKEALITIIQFAHERNITFNEAIATLLQSFIEQHNSELIAN